MPSAHPHRSGISFPAVRRCRLARRLACGLTPGEVARIEATTEEGILFLLEGADFFGLVAQYRAVAELPEAEREQKLLAAAWAELEHLMEFGDRRAVLFVVYEMNRGRHPARRLVERVKETFAEAADRDPARPVPASPAGSSPETMQGYGQHPLGPAHHAARRLADHVPLEAGRLALFEAGRGAAASAFATPAAEVSVAPAAPVAGAPATLLPTLPRPASQPGSRLRTALLGGTGIATLAGRPRKTAGRRPLGP